MTPHKETVGSLELMSGLYYRAWQTVKPIPETLRKVNRGSPEQHPIQLPAVAEPARGQERQGVCAGGIRSLPDALELEGNPTA